MPYIALKRLKVGETETIIGQDTVGIKKVGTRRIGTDGGGNPIMEDVFDPILADVHAPLYREVGELVPEAENWKDPALWVRQGFIQYVSDHDVPRAADQAVGSTPGGPTEDRTPRKRAGTVKAS